LAKFMRKQGRLIVKKVGKFDLKGYNQKVGVWNLSQCRTIRRKVPLNKARHGLKFLNSLIPLGDWI